MIIEMHNEAVNRYMSGATHGSKSHRKKEKPRLTYRRGGFKECESLVSLMSSVVYKEFLSVNHWKKIPRSLLAIILENGVVGNYPIGRVAGSTIVRKHVVISEDITDVQVWS